jgi:DNA repair exonuclease SbcCD ATPase subunit
MIVFTTIRWKNLLSTGNVFTEIKLDKSVNTLIVGQNGAGKSTILDALTFALFGKPFRKINKPQLMNSINNSNCVVECEFNIGKKKYKIVRGMKPNIFEIYCDDVLINQDAKAMDYQEHLEKNILKLNYKSFTQVIVLGSAAFVPFMQLSASDRRAIIEELLDIGIFSSMNTIVKNKLSEIKDKQRDTEYTLKLTAEKIELQKQNIEEHKKNSQDEIDRKNAEISKNVEFINETMKNVGLIQKHIDVLSKQVEDEQTLSTKNNKMLQIESKFEDSLKKLKKEIQFYEDNDSCPTCQQAITPEHKEKHLTEKNDKIIQLNEAATKLNQELMSITERIGKIASVQKHIGAHQSEILKLNTQISSINSYNTKVLQEIKKLEENSVSIGKDNNKLKELKKELEKAIATSKELSSEKQYHEFAATLLKDTGIKTRIIKQYLPVMNKLINKYLTAMEFFVNFNLNENFEETIKSRHRDEFSYASFSEGEKMRIDLALLFTWRQIAKMKNSVSTNLLILDEVFDSSLDGVGTEEFMKLLNSMDKSTNVFVISHKGDQLFDKFRSVIRFEKKNNFSQVAK